MSIDLTDVLGAGVSMVGVHFAWHVPGTNLSDYGTLDSDWLDVVLPQGTYAFRLELVGVGISSTIYWDSLTITEV
jgi:hypothetical protein